MKRLFILFFICVATATCLSAAAHKEVSINGFEDTYYAPPYMSLAQAKLEALHQAKQKALEQKFGTIINSTTNIHLDNRNSDVQTYASHEVKGEWVRDTREPEQEPYYDPSMPNTTIIRTRIWGVAREITAAKIDIDVHLLKDTLQGSDTEVFADREHFYVSLQTPVAGFVAVYVLDADEDRAFCLLPSAQDKRGAVPVRNNKRYVFFSSKYAANNYAFEDRSLGKECFFTTERPVLYNQLYVVFSPNEFIKALDEQKTDPRYTRPRETTISQFQKWLSTCKARDTQLVEKIITVKIVN